MTVAQEFVGALQFETFHIDRVVIVTNKGKTNFESNSGQQWTKAMQIECGPNKNNSFEFYFTKQTETIS